MDVTIDIGVGVTDDGTVVLVDDFVLIDIGKVHVTTDKQILVAILLNDILAVG